MKVVLKLLRKRKQLIDECHTDKYWYIKRLLLQIIIDKKCDL